MLLLRTIKVNFNITETSASKFCFIGKFLLSKFQFEVFKIKIFRQIGFIILF